MNETKRLLNDLGNKPRPQNLVPIATDMFVPNHSGTHDAGILNKTPSKDNDLVNKKYVDDEIAGIVIPAETDPLSLHLDQTSKQTLTDSPIINDLTATRVPFVDSDKSLTDSSKLTFSSTGLLTIVGDSVNDGLISTGKFLITGNTQAGGSGSTVVINAGAGFGTTGSAGGTCAIQGGSGSANTAGTSGTITGGAGSIWGFNTGRNNGLGGNCSAVNGTSNCIGGKGSSWSFGALDTSFKYSKGGNCITATTGNNTGGQGGTFDFVAGGGGDASSGTINTGGASGTITFTSSPGGTATSAAGKTARGGAGGHISFTGSNGGAASGAGTNTGGAGANVTFTSGLGGTGTTAGANGNIIFKSGTTEIGRFDNTAGSVGNFRLTADNQKIQLGTAQDAEIYYDGTDLIINPRVVGSGDLKVLGGSVNSVGGFKANGTAGISATITTAALTAGGAQGSMTFVSGILTAQTQAT